MTEFLIILPVLLFLILGGLQIIFIYQVKTTLNYATFEATRAGTLENAQLKPIANGFSRGMAPYFARPPDNKDTEKSIALLNARDIVKNQIDNGMVRFYRVNPTKNSFDTFGVNTAGILQIPNNHLSFRDANVTDGKGLSIQDANILKIRVNYCMELIVPFANKIIETTALILLDTSNSESDFDAHCMGDDNSTRLPITAYAVMRMQSPAQSCPNCFANSDY